MSIHLLSTINSAYVVPFQVMAHSLHRCRQRTLPVTWHICELGLTAEARVAIQRRLEGLDLKVSWHAFDAGRLVGLPVWGRAVAAMYERIFVPDTLPESVTRLLYLDGDLLFLDAVETLWDSEIHGSIVGAVQDAVIQSVSSPMGLRQYRALGLPPTAPYFNAGVLLIDLDAWRAGRVAESAVAYLDRYRRSINLADQDALNAVLNARWTRLDDRWNIIGGVAGRAGFGADGADASRMRAAVRNPAIIHFAGHLKPWRYRRLASRWYSAYEDALLEVFPDHRFDRSLTAVGTVFYDRHLRRALYPLERLAWRTSRYLS